MGPSKGIPDRHSAAEAPVMARMSGSFSWSPDITRQMTCTSFRNPSGNSGRIGRSMRREVRGGTSPGDSVLLYYGPVPLDVVVLEVFEEPTTLADQHQEAAPRMMVLRMPLEVFGQAVDPLGEERDLDLRRSGIAVVNPELLDQGFLLLEGERHGGPPSIATPQELCSAGTGSKNLFLSAITQQGTMPPPAK